MGGSKGGKRTKSKGKTKLRSKPDTAIDLNHLHSSGTEDARGKHPQSFISDALTSGRSKYTDKDLEAFLHAKLEGLYDDAKAYLKKLRYNKTDVDRAILHNGHLHGPMDLLNNVLTNSIAFLEQKVKVSTRPFRNMSQLYEVTKEAMVDTLTQAHPSIKRSDAIWVLLLKDWGDAEFFTITSHLQSGDQSNRSPGCSSQSAPNSASASKEVPSESTTESSMEKRTPENVRFTSDLICIMRKFPLLTTMIVREIGTLGIEDQASGSSSGEPAVGSDILELIGNNPYEACLKRWPNRNPNDPKLAMIVDLLKNIGHLQHRVKEYKDWAGQKAIDSLIKLNKSTVELRTLRAEKVDIDHLKKEIMSAEESCRKKLMVAGRALRNTHCELSCITDAERRLKMDNAKIRADIEAYKLNSSEASVNTNEVLKRERRCLKIAASTEKLASNLRARYEEEKQRELLLQEGVVQAEKEVEEAEIRWKHEIKEKELMFARVAEETKFSEIRRATRRAQLLELRQKIEIDRRIARDKRKKLEDELSRLQISHQSQSTSMVDGKLLFNDVEVRSSESSAKSSTSHRKCMICFKNEVSVLFLPCTHQVVCFRCYTGKSGSVDGRCPCCHVAIEQGIRVYGPSC